MIYRWFRILLLAYAALLVWYQGGTIERLREDQRFLADGWEHAARLCVELVTK